MPQIRTVILTKASDQTFAVSQAVYVDWSSLTVLKNVRWDLGEHQRSKIEASPGGTYLSRHLVKQRNCKVPLSSLFTCGHEGRIGLDEVAGLMLMGQELIDDVHGLLNGAHFAD